MHLIEIIEIRSEAQGLNPMHCYTENIFKNIMKLMGTFIQVQYELLIHFSTSILKKQKNLLSA